MITHREAQTITGTRFDYESIRSDRPHYWGPHIWSPSKTETPKPEAESESISQNEVWARWRRRQGLES